MTIYLPTERLVWLTISWFGVSGKFTYARGTWGTLAALPLAWIIQVTLGNLALAAAGCVLFVIGVIASDVYVRMYGKEDPGEIVIDEVAAICVLLSFMQPNAVCYITAFIVFRAFDVVKPWPVSLADRSIKGGFGVMFDDMLAALYPVLLMLLLSIIAPGWAGGIFAWLGL